MSWLLVFCMVISVFPMQALADELQPTTQGLTALDTSANLPLQTFANGENQFVVPAAYGENPFTDVPQGAWFHDAALYAYRNGLFSGTGSDTFSPNDNMTRGMYVTVLGRMSNVDVLSYAKTVFNDVNAGDYYAPYVAWAVEKGITSGVGDGNFDPNGLVTRQQMATFTARFFNAYGYNYPPDTVNTIPKDYEQIADYAKDAVLKLWASGMFVGDSEGNFNPGSNTTRAEAATFLMRTNEHLGKSSYRISDGGRPSEGGAPQPGKTTYYNVNFKMGDGQDETGVALPPSKAYESGTKISSLPTPYKKNHIFLGWYYDSAMQNGVKSNDVVNKNMTLYAKMAETSTNLAPNDAPAYITKTDVGTDFTFAVKASSVDEVKSALTITNITATNTKVNYNVEKTGDYYTITATYTAGQTYKATLAEGSPVVFWEYGTQQPTRVRTLNFITAKAEVQNLTLDSDMKYLPVSSVTNMTGTVLGGLFNLTVRGKSAVAQENKYSGTFDYAGGDIAVGDTVAIYDGVRPDLRTKDSLDADNGNVGYVTITSINGNTYTYTSAEAEDVIFKPDILPVPTTADMDGDASNHSITVLVSVMDFSSDKYAVYGLDSQTKVDRGDFIAFYTGQFGQEGEAIAGYGKITSVRRDENNNYIIAYTDATEADVLSSMDIVQTREEQVNLTDEQIAEIESRMGSQAIKSGFVEEATKYLTALALETDGFKELSDSINLKTLSIDTADGTQLIQGKAAAMEGGSRVEITKKEVSATVAAGKVLQHFDGSMGVRAELALSFVAEISPKQGSDNKIEISMQAVFEQEILLSINTSGGAIWKTAWIIPYIYDYSLNANIDLGTFTGIGITATAKTIGADEDDGFDWKDVTGNKYEIAIINIMPTEQIKIRIIADF